VRVEIERIVERIGLFQYPELFENVYTIQYACNKIIPLTY